MATGRIQAFSDPIKAEFSNDGKSITLLEGFVYVRAEAWKKHTETGKAISAKDKIVVPTGFKSDGFSVPFPLNALVPSYGKGVKAALLHDFLYEKDSPVSRKEADEIFLEAMLTTNAYSEMVAKIMYWSVRLFGESNYDGKIK